MLNGGNQAEQTPTGPPDMPALLTLGREQQVAAVQLSHYVYTLLCIISQLMTSVDRYKQTKTVIKQRMN